MKAMNKMEAIWNCIANGQACDLEAETREEMWTIAIANKLAGGGSESSGSESAGSVAFKEFGISIYNYDGEYSYECTFGNGEEYECAVEGEVADDCIKLTVTTEQAGYNYIYSYLEPCQFMVRNYEKGLSEYISNYCYDDNKFGIFYKSQHLTPAVEVFIPNPSFLEE